MGIKSIMLPIKKVWYLGVVTTKSGVNEVSNLQEVLQCADLPSGIPLKGDKGDESERNASLLNKRKLKNHILKKAKRGKPLTDFEKRFNKRVGETRFKEVTEFIEV